MQTILFVGGGSLGHIAPSIAVAQQLQELEADTNCHFVCQDKALETSYIVEHGYPYSTLSAPRLGLGLLWKFWGAYGSAKQLLKDLKPAAVFSKGGHVSVPVCLAAKHLGIPIVLHESDAVMGRANRLISLLATEVCTGFPIRDTWHHTGNPLRQGVTAGSRDEALKITGFSGSRPVLLVVGGSQGALAINEAIVRHLDALTKVCDVIHVTGHGKLIANSCQLSAYYAVEFAVEELPHFYALADLAISRAGGGSINELVANHVPLILVPLRGVGHDHQQKNADVLSGADAAVVMQQASLDNGLVSTVSDLLGAKNDCAHMAAKAQELLQTGASLQIAKIVLKTLASSRSSS